MSKWAGINRARARRVAGDTMNRVEREWSRQLQLQLIAGQIRWWGHEPMRFKLAKGSTYTPDFAVILLDYSVRFDEVKGQRGWKLDDEGRTKWKIAGELFPWFLFCGQMKSKQGWEEELYQPSRQWPAT